MKTIDKKKKRCAVIVELNNKSNRGSYEVKHDKNSKLNYISVKDSKVVSVLSCAAGVTPLVNVKRWSGIQNAKVELPFPQATAAQL